MTQDFRPVTSNHAVDATIVVLGHVAVKELLVGRRLMFRGLLGERS